MQRLVDISGETFGRLTCIQRAGKDKRGKSLWLCICECGNVLVVKQNSLVTKGTRSCGCLQKESAIKEGKKKFKHGISKNSSSGIYKSWSHMKQRCLNENDKSYPRYGGRGIKVCNEWLEFNNFYRWSLKNGYEQGLSIERINNQSDYEPGNCKWASSREQNNNKSNNRKITFNGKQMNLSEWSEVLHINYHTLYDRLYKGWSIERAFATPTRKKNINA